MATEKRNISELERLVSRIAKDPEAIAQAQQSDADYAAGRYTIDDVPAIRIERSVRIKAGSVAAARARRSLVKAAG